MKWTKIDAVMNVIPGKVAERITTATLVLCAVAFFLTDSVQFGAFITLVLKSVGGLYIVCRLAEKIFGKKKEVIHVS